MSGLVERLRATKPLRSVRDGKIATDDIAAYVQDAYALRHEAATEIERLTATLADITACTHRPNPTDPSRIDVAPGKHKAFGDAIRRALHTEESQP